MIELTNAERTKKGIAPLKFDEGLTAAAMVRARESASSFSHTRPNKESFYTILDDFNLTWMSARKTLRPETAAKQEVLHLKWLWTFGSIHQDITTT